MLFGSLTFLLGFLPAFMLIYALIKEAWRSAFLFAASLLFYGWLYPPMILLLLFEIILGYVCGRMIDSRRYVSAKTVLIFGCVALVGLLAWFKYFQPLSQWIGQTFSLDILFPSIFLPAGISFYTFQILSYLADVYTGRAPVQKSFVLFGCYVAMFPQLTAGPIVRYSQILPQLEHRSLTWDNQRKGSARFVCGLAKKLVLADSLSLFCSQTAQLAHPSVLLEWVRAMALFLSIYYDFSGYTDMACGLGTMMGFTLPENFRYPLMASSMTDFWRRWHLSLSEWFRDYVYIPLGGSRCSKSRQLFNLLVVWLLTGIWHGAGWNYVAWGLGFFVWLALEKFVLPEGWKKSPLYTLVCWVGILLLFQLFSAASLPAFGKQCLALFGLASLPFVSAQSLFWIETSAVLLVVSIAGAFPIARKLFEKLERSLAGKWVAIALQICVLVVCIAWSASGNSQPFLYFQF